MRTGTGRTSTLEVEGLQVAGFSDPLEWEGPDPASSERDLLLPRVRRRRRAATRRPRRTWSPGSRRFRSSPTSCSSTRTPSPSTWRRPSPDGYPQPLTIVTGHNHFQAIDRYAGGLINVVNAGTLGAGGPFRVGQESAGLGELHFSDVDPALQSVDLIQIEPLSGQAQAERVVLDVICPPAEIERRALPLRAGLSRARDGPKLRCRHARARRARPALPRLDRRGPPRRRVPRADGGARRRALAGRHRSRGGPSSSTARRRTSSCARSRSFSRRPS